MNAFGCQKNLEQGVYKFVYKPLAAYV